MIYKTCSSLDMFTYEFEQDLKKNELDDHMEIATGKHLKRNMNNSLYDQEA